MLNIDYAEGLNLDVRTSIGSIEDLDCTLLIANNSFPQLGVMNAFFNKELREYIKTPPISITCRSQQNIFTLYNNESSGSSFIPEFIVSGHEVGNITGVDISLSGLYCFFDGRSNFEFKDSYIRKKTTDCFVRTQFYINSELYCFSVRHDFSYIKKIDTTTLIEDAFVRVWKPTGSMLLDEIKGVVKKNQDYIFSFAGF